METVSNLYIADRLRELRKNADLDVETVGEGVGRSGKTVSAWETGRNVPSAYMLIKLCEFFGVDIDYFYPPEVSNVRYTLMNLEGGEGEADLLRLFRSMSAEGQSRLMEQAAFLAERHPKNKAAAV